MRNGGRVSQRNGWRANETARDEVGPILGITRWSREGRGVYNVPSRPPASFTRTPLSMNFPRSSTVSFLPLMVREARGVVCGRAVAPVDFANNGRTMRSVAHFGLANLARFFFPLEVENDAQKKAATEARCRSRHRPRALPGRNGMRPSHRIRAVTRNPRRPGPRRGLPDGQWAPLPRLAK